jgi:hypothetical protein
MVLFTAWNREGRWYPPGLWEGWIKNSEGVVEGLASRNERSEWRLAKMRFEIMDTSSILALIDFWQKNNSQGEENVSLRILHDYSPK